jgi:hypothetical protein
MDIDNIYYKKYLKYKNKYLELKQSGGSTYLEKLAQYKITCIYYLKFLIQLLNSFIDKLTNSDEIKKKLNIIKEAVERSFEYLKNIEIIMKKTVETSNMLGLHIRSYNSLQDYWNKEKDTIKITITSIKDQYKYDVKLKDEYNKLSWSNYLREELKSFDNRIGTKKFYGFVYLNYEAKKGYSKGYEELEKFDFMNNIKNTYGDYFEILSKIIDSYFDYFNTTIYELLPYDKQATIKESKRLHEMYKIEEERKVQKKIDDKKRIEDLKKSIRQTKLETKEIIEDYNFRNGR